MEDSKAEQRLEKRISSLSKGLVGHEAEADATKGVELVKLQKGFVLCDFVVHDRVSDERGKWHEGAMMTLMDAVGSWAAFSFTSLDQITVYLSVSFNSKPNLQEVVEVEGKATGEKGRMTSLTVEVRTKSNGQIVALGIMLMAAPSHQINKPPSSKL